MTVISITHDLEEAARADRIMVMNKGKLYREGTPEEIFQMDEELIELGLDIPFPVKMSKLLKEMGLDILNHIYQKKSWWQSYGHLTAKSRVSLSSKYSF